MNERCVSSGDSATGDAGGRPGVLRDVVAICGGIGVASGTGFILFYRFTHPGLTETQLFLALWPVIAWIIGAALVLMVASRD